MSVTALNNAASNASGNVSQIAGKPTAAEQASADYEDFLLLLTAQLKNQDPLQPMDSTNFVSQLAQFSNVEQQVKMNDKLDNLVSNLTGSDFAEANSFLGRYITATDGRVQINSDATETSFDYKTAADVDSAKAIIKDRFGKTVKEINLPLAPNGTSHKWDLMNDEDEKINPGRYNIMIETTNKDDVITQIPAETKVKVLQANKTDKGFEFITDTDQKISQDAIRKIHVSL